MQGNEYVTVNPNCWLQAQDGTNHPAIEFSIDASRSYGVINVTDEISLYYDTVTGEWSGDAIRPEGWVDLSPEEVAEIVEALDLQQEALALAQQ